MRNVLLSSMIVCGMLIVWGCGKSEDGGERHPELMRDNPGAQPPVGADRGKSEPVKPPVAEEHSATEHHAAVAVSPTATATVEVTGEVKPAVLPHTITDAEVGLSAVCPVMKTPVTVNKNTLSAEYKGQVYYFCCGDCPGQFKDNPEKFITTTETEKK